MTSSRVGIVCLLGVVTAAGHATSGNGEGSIQRGDSISYAREQQLANGDFFKQAKRSISHDKSVLQRLEKHPLAHASGWQISETQDSGNGWTENSAPAAPQLGSKEWSRQNDVLEKDLETMSDSVNTMFKDQSDKRKYRRDEDKLFSQAVDALKTADKLYPDSPDQDAADLRSLGVNPDGSFAHDEGRRSRRKRSGAGSRSRNGGGADRASAAGMRLTSGSRIVTRSRSPADWYSGPNMTEVMLILIGCTLLAAAGWIGFMFCRRKSYYDIRARGEDKPDGIEVP